jgi:16S rRNA processing protein RimM
VHPVLRVASTEAREDGKPAEERLIPYVDQYVKTVSREDGKIVVDWGLDY